MTPTRIHSQPTRVCFGPGSCPKLVEIARQLGRRPFAFWDKALRRLDSTITRARTLEPESKAFFDVEPNPTARLIFVELPVRLRDAGAEAAELDRLVKASLYPLMNNDPRPAIQEQLRSS